LPQVRIDAATITEEFVRGGIAKPSVQLPLLVATERTLGAAALAAFVETVMDAIETDANGNADPCLGGLLRRPLGMTFAGTQANEASLNGVLTVTMKPNKALRRGKRVTT
jgi:hypothetical protein